MIPLGKYKSVSDYIWKPARQFRLKAHARSYAKGSDFKTEETKIQVGFFNKRFIYVLHFSQLRKLKIVFTQLHSSESKYTRIFYFLF